MNTASAQQIERFHPIVKRAIAGLRKSANAELDLNPTIAEKLRQDMRALFDKPELKTAVEGLVQLAFFLDDSQHAHAAASALLGITCEATDALRAQAKQLATKAQQARAVTSKVPEVRGTGLPTPMAKSGAQVRHKR